MLKSKLLHPTILSALAGAGHGSKVLIADGNYPASTARGPRAELVSLNLSPGVVGCVEVLEALAATVPIEAAAVMETLKEGPYAMAEDPPIWAEFARVLVEQDGPGELDRIERLAFYDAAATPEVALTIQTGERRVYANLLLTIGVRGDA